jgi:opacity protein-like surface antigen
MPSKFNLITFITLTVFGTVTAITVNAQNSGSYIGIAGGLTIPDDSDIRGSGINSKVDFDETASGSILAGHAFENGLRGEFELTGRKADVDDVSGSSAGTGEVQVWNVMANIIYDFQSTAKISPYLGAGIGYAIPDYDGVRPVGGSVLSDSNGNLAYQGIAGVGYKLSRRFTLFSDYRYFGIGDVGLQTDSRADVDAEYREHRLTVGLRWTFSGPPEKEQTAPKIQPAAISPQAPVAPPKPAEAAPAMVQAPPPVAPKKVVAPRAYLVFLTGILQS